jgi:hypothetical protein
MLVFTYHISYCWDERIIWRSEFMVSAELCLLCTVQEALFTHTQKNLTFCTSCLLLLWPQKLLSLMFENRQAIVKLLLFPVTIISLSCVYVVSHLFGHKENNFRFVSVSGEHTVCVVPHWFHSTTHFLSNVYETRCFWPHWLCQSKTGGRKPLYAGYVYIFYLCVRHMYVYTPYAIWNNVI